MGTDGDFRGDGIGKATVAERDGIEMGWVNFGITGWAIWCAQVLISGGAGRWVIGRWMGCGGDQDRGRAMEFG